MKGRQRSGQTRNKKNKIGHMGKAKKNKKKTMLTNQKHSKHAPEKKKKFSDELIVKTIFERCQEAGIESSVKPEAIARELYPEQWQTLLKRVRLFSGQMAKRGEIVVLRKGKPLGPDDEIRGLVKLRIAAGAVIVDKAPIDDRSSDKRFSDDDPSGSKAA